MSVWKLSAGTAVVLQLTKFRVEEKTTTAYILLGENCLQACKFCAQARTSMAAKDKLSRVIWRQFTAGEIVKAIENSYRQGLIKRACLQIVGEQDSWQHTIEAVRAIKTASAIPLSVSSCINSVNQAKYLVDCGVDRIGIALDGATPDVYVNSKQSNWNKRWELLLACAAACPQKISTHLIVGLGETEQEMVGRLAECIKRDITVGLFAFTPIRGTEWEKKEPPNLASYRRIQLAHYLLKQGYSLEIFNFKNQKLVKINMVQEEMRAMISGGNAFMTSGCPGCNRPYYNERPGQIFYNYPRQLTLGEVQEAYAACELQEG